MRILGTWLIWLCAFGFAHAQTDDAVNKMDPIEVTKTQDFELSGDGQAVSWQRTDWYSLPQRSNLENVRETKLKVLYSETGIYFLFYCQDEVLTASKTADFEKLWLEDVVEVFLWPDTDHTIYFEYEISPLNYELPILIPNINGEFLGWRPWQYTGDRKIKHLTKVVGGKKATGAKISGWYAEFFIPYELLRPLSNVPPQTGTTWRVNMYRVDHDYQKIAFWSWQETEKSFHEIKKFGPMIFR